MRRVLGIVLLLAASCSAPPEHGPVQPMGGMAVLVRLSARDRQIVVEGDGVLKSVEFSGAQAVVRLTTGQVLLASYDARAAGFRVEVLEDADSSIDVAIGRTTVHATRGDVFEARVIDTHLDVLVRRGLVVVVGPDERRAELAQGNQLTVSGGGSGAIQGATGEVPRERALRGLPKEPRRGTILDRTDIAPAP